MRKKLYKDIFDIAIVASIYVVLTIVIQPLAYGELQFRLSEVLEKAVLKEEKSTKPGDKNQKPYSKLLIMFYDGIKLTVGVQKTTNEKVQYCLTAVGATKAQ